MENKKVVWDHHTALYGWMGSKQIPVTASRISKDVSPQIREFLEFVYILNCQEGGTEPKFVGPMRKMSQNEALKEIREANL